MALPANWKIGFAEILGFVSLAASILAAGYVVGVALGGIETDVAKLGVKVEKNSEAIIRVEAQTKIDQAEILKQLDRQGQAMETIRVESKSDRERILDALKDLVDKVHQ